MYPELPANVDPQVDDLNGRYEDSRGPAPVPSNPKSRTLLTANLTRFTFSSNHFDLVHSQIMAGGIHADRWRSYFRDIFRVLRPGGWAQMIEIYFNAQSDNGTLTDGAQRL
jgi:ubiquinone/menaquinone biosynthesis C-methylase UbiE